MRCTLSFEPQTNPKKFLVCALHCTSLIFNRLQSESVQHGIFYWVKRPWEGEFPQHFSCKFHAVIDVPVPSQWWHVEHQFWCLCCSSHLQQHDNGFFNISIETTCLIKAQPTVVVLFCKGKKQNELKKEHFFLLSVFVWLWQLDALWKNV